MVTLHMFSAWNSFVDIFPLVKKNLQCLYVSLHTPIHPAECPVCSPFKIAPKTRQLVTFPASCCLRYGSGTLVVLSWFPSSSLLWFILYSAATGILLTYDLESVTHFQKYVNHRFVSLDLCTAQWVLVSLESCKFCSPFPFLHHFEKKLSQITFPQTALYSFLGHWYLHPPQLSDVSPQLICVHLVYFLLHITVYTG